MPKVEVPADQVFAVLKENILVDGFHVVIDLEKSHGAVIVDALEGNEYPDWYWILRHPPGWSQSSQTGGRGFSGVPQEGGPGKSVWGGNLTDMIRCVRYLG